MFWTIRDDQAKKQGGKTGKKEQGAWTAVDGGAHTNGFLKLFRGLLAEAVCRTRMVFVEKQVELPGYFRPENKWDLLIVVARCLIATIECKSHVGPSFGNNYNNRTEQAVGNASDLLAAYREGAFKPSKKPWFGYLLLLEASPGSLSPVAVKEPHFPVFEEFRGVSYARRYEILLTRRGLPPAFRPASGAHGAVPRARRRTQLPEVRPSPHGASDRLQENELSRAPCPGSLSRSTAFKTRGRDPKLGPSATREGLLVGAYGRAALRPRRILPD